MTEYNIDFTPPAHVGIIMDGNGRWAASRHMIRALGHRAGMERLHEIVRVSSDIGVSALSLYAFSTENWKRPKQEVDALMGLLIEYFGKEIDELDKRKVCIRHLGDIEGFPQKVNEVILQAVERTKANTGLKLNIALNYGSRKEIVSAVKQIAEEYRNGSISEDEITEKAISDRLYTKGLSDPDLVIRTSGEMRLSNFLMYQAAYSELMFVNEHWPDFSNEKYIECLRNYSMRNRRFGGI